MTKTPKPVQSTPNDARLRMFIALPLPKELLNALAQLIDKLKKGCAFTPCKPSWVDPQSIHLTLAFLGSRPADDVDKIAPLIDQAARDMSALRLDVKGLSVFPDWRRPKVLWAGGRERTHQLATLHERLTRRLTQLGWDPDHREFKPHLTLARFKSLTGTAALEQIVRSHRNFEYSGAILDEIVLFKSELQPDGARHTPLHVMRLK